MTMGTTNPRRHAFITRLLPEPAPTLLREAFALRGNLEDVPLSRTDLLAGVRGAEAIVCTLTDPVDAGVMDSAGPQLRVISTCAVGFDNIDVAAATERHVFVATTPDVLTDATAELTWALILATARRVVEGDRLVKSGGFHGWSPSMLLGMELRGRTLGVVGMGRIGTAVARIANGFGMAVVYVRRSGPLPAESVPLGARWRYATCLEDLLKVADIVSLHVPLSDGTRHLLGRRELECMRPGSILINTSRGPVVDEQALVERIRSGALRGAGLDVYEAEPNLTAGLVDLPNVVLLPHLGSATVETRRRMAEFAALNAIAAFTDGNLHAVNAEALRLQGFGSDSSGDGVPSQR